MVASPILSVRDLEKTYRRGLFRRKGFRAIDGVSLEVGRGTVFGLLGPNGAGKTTMIKVLLGLVPSYGGEAQLFGKPPKDPDSRRRIGFLPEAHRLPGYLTGWQVMELFGRLSGVSPKELRPRIGELLERVDMTANANRKVREYSKGMQQRIGLAQALVHQPELVFLDEPTDGVDPVGRAKIRELVQELKEAGVTVFINSHLLMEVEQICDRVVIMHRGKIAREGTIEELTPETGSVRLEVDRDDLDWKAMVGDLGTLKKASGREAHLAISTTHQNALIDRLRAQGVGIHAMVPHRQSLEESFIDLVLQQEGGAV